MANKQVENGTLLSASAILFVLTLLAGTLPVHLIQFLSKRFNQKNGQSSNAPKSSFMIQMKIIFSKDRIVQFLAQLGGGVLLYTALIHMLPEIRENYETYLNDKNVTSKADDESEDKDGLPLVDFCACAGFFGIFLIEELMHTFFLKNHDHHHHETSQNGQAKAKNHPLTRRLSMRQYMQTRKHYQAHVDENENTARVDTNGEKNQQNQLATVLTETHPISTGQPSRYDACEQSDVAIDSNGIVSKCDVENISNFESMIQEDRTIFARIFDALLMILAFSCHAVFDGISIGVQSGSKVWTVLIAILSHKLLIAFILSVQIHERCFQTVKEANQPGELPQSKPIKRALLILWLFSTIFAAMSPIGIFIVMAMGSSSDAPVEKELHIIILAAISAGTIIYICFLEIIDKSSSRTYISGLVQWIALIVGFGLMHLVSSLFHEE